MWYIRSLRIQLYTLSFSFYLWLWISQPSIFLFCECCTFYLVLNDNSFCILGEKRCLNKRRGTPGKAWLLAKVPTCIKPFVNIHNYRSNLKAFLLWLPQLWSLKKAWNPHLALGKTIIQRLISLSHLPCSMPIWSPNDLPTKARFFAFGAFQN